MAITVTENNKNKFKKCNLLQVLGGQHGGVQVICLPDFNQDVVQALMQVVLQGVDDYHLYIQSRCSPGPPNVDS